MSGEFLGNFENAVHNHRITIPAAFKKKFSTAAKQTVVVSLGYDGRHIAVFPLDYWIKYSDMLRKGTDEQRNRLIRIREFALPEQELEGPGRIRVNSDLLEIAGITDRVTIKGDGNYITLWDPGRLEKERAKKLTAQMSSGKASDYEIPYD
jgi:DNA-binding transcriptional regulator/RsmH inhibitor MraZ